MQAARHRRGQRGIVSILTALLLISGVVFIIAQSFGIMRSRSIDTSQSGNSTAAFMLAESGVERAQAIVASAMAAGTATNTTCTSLLTDGPFTLGRGTFSYTAAVSTPTTCDSAGTTPCTACNFTAKGVVGSTERSLGLNMDFTDAIGITGRGTTVKLVVKNTSTTVDAIAILDLTWRKLQRSGSNVATTYTDCTTTTCSPTLLWSLNSSSGGAARGGGIGSAMSIPRNSSTGLVTTQVLNTGRDYVEVGGLFPGTATAPTPVLRAAFWSDSSQTWGGNSATTGLVNSGVANTADLTASTCLRGSTVMDFTGSTAPKAAQTCNSWCNAADTLVFGFSGQGTTVADETTAASFNSVPMTRLLHFPNTDGTIANATGRIYSEIYYKYNAPYSSTVTSATSATSGANGATSYTGAIVGTTTGGATLSFSGSGKINNGSNNGTIQTISGSQICVGNSIVATNLPPGTTISSLSGAVGGCVPASATNVALVVSANSTGNVTSATVPSTTLTPSKTTTALSTGTATVLDPTTGATSQTITISAVNGGGTSYTLASPGATISTASYVVQGTGLSTTIKVAAAADLPATTGTIVNVFSKSTSPLGAGVFAANTTITAIDTATNTFTVSAAPTTGLVGARLCGGTCALFNDASSTTSTTTFSITKTAGTAQWSGGFVCLSGVNPNAIATVRSSTFRSRTWSEAIQ